MTKMTKNTKQISTPFYSSQARHIMQDDVRNSKSNKIRDTELTTENTF